MQRYILALLYLDSGGDNWINNDKWISSAHECDWFGVTCNSFEGLVDKIDLSSNNLDGFLPSELGELRGLEYLVRDNIEYFSFKCNLFTGMYKTLGSTQQYIGWTNASRVSEIESFKESRSVQ